jgi:RNA polymerase sigma-70 factor (ECF subfamily)
MVTVDMSGNGHLPEDAELLNGIAAQDRGSFHQLYERYAPQALGLATRVLGDRSAGEDVLQEAFLRIWHNASKFDVERGTVKTWVMTIVHRLAIDAVRRRQVRPSIAIDAPEYEDWDLPDEEANVHDAVYDKISHAQVHSAMSELPQAHRQIVELAYFKGLTHREIAEHLQEPLGTVHSRARQSITLLKKLLWNRVAG